MKKRVLIAGDGIAGVEAAIQLRRAGMPVTLISNRSSLCPDRPETSKLYERQPCKTVQIQSDPHGGALKERGVSLSDSASRSDPRSSLSRKR